MFSIVYPSFKSRSKIHLLAFHLAFAASFDVEGLIGASEPVVSTKCQRGRESLCYVAL